MMSTDTSSTPRRSSLQIQVAAIRALFLRELQTRFGGYRLGYLWSILEPGIHVTFMLLLFTTILGKTVPNMSYPLFLVCGILPWFMFTRISTRALSAISANKGLFNYRPVRPIDAVLARSVLEGIIYFLVFIIFLIILAWFNQEVSLSHIPLLLSLWMSLWVLSCSVAVFMMILGHYSEEVAKIIPILFRILYFSSGILYSIHRIPEQYQIYVLWNPVLHAIEQIRHAMDPDYPVYHVSYGYLLLCNTCVMFVALVLYKWRERRMMTSS